MLQSEIDRAVARATGESRRMIVWRGFSLDDPSPENADGVHLALDCPGCGRSILLQLQPFTQFPGEVECSGCDAVYHVRPDEMFVVEAPDAALA